MAARLAMTPESYRDLEWYDEEAFMAVSLDNLAALGRALNISPRVLLFGDRGGDDQLISFAEIAARVGSHARRGSVCR